METTISVGSVALVEMELWLELVNLGLALWVLWVVYSMKDRVRGVLGHIWNLLGLAAVAFAAVELIGILTLTNVANVSGWVDIAELILIISLLLVVNHLRKVK